MANVRRLVAGFGLATVLIACTPTAIVQPTVVIPRGLHPRLTLADVSKIVIDQIHDMEGMVGRVLRTPRIISITANHGGPAAPGFDGVTWIVKAEGTFATNKGRGGRPPIPPAPTGSLQISDADGAVVGFGFP